VLRTHIKDAALAALPGASCTFPLARSSYHIPAVSPAVSPSAHAAAPTSVAASATGNASSDGPFSQFRLVRLQDAEAAAPKPSSASAGSPSAWSKPSAAAASAPLPAHGMSLSGFELYGDIYVGAPVPDADADADAAAAACVRSAHAEASALASPTAAAATSFRHEYDFDQNGLLYYLGTAGLTQPYTNPGACMQGSVVARWFRVWERCFTRVLHDIVIFVHSRVWRGGSVVIVDPT
jgi:hypothetical protein